MFKVEKFDVVVGNHGFIIKKQGEHAINRIDYALNIPNVPFYQQLFDKDKAYIINN